MSLRLKKFAKTLGRSVFPISLLFPLEAMEAFLKDLNRITNI